MRYRPKRENYATGQFGEIDYQEMLERYCTYLENQNKQLRIGGVSQQRELLIAFAEWVLSSEEDITSQMIKKDVNTFLATNSA